MSEVVTGEAVALDLRLAKLPSRLVAGGLDLALQVGVLLALLVLGGVVLRGADGGLAATLIVLLIVAVFIGYPVTMETLTRGRTLGKMVMGIRVVRDDGGPISFRQALVRGLFAGLVEKPGLLLGLTAPVAVLVMLISHQGKRIGDFAAGTVVLQERVPAPRTVYAAQMPPPLVAWATTLDLTRLDDSLALSVRQFLSRLPQLGAGARASLGDSLAGAVASRVTPAPPPGTPAWIYLNAVLAERRRREQLRLGGRTPVSPDRPAFAAPPAFAPPAFDGGPTPTNDPIIGSPGPAPARDSPTEPDRAAQPFAPPG